MKHMNNHYEVQNSLEGKLNLQLFSDDEDEEEGDDGEPETEEEEDSAESQDGKKEKRLYSKKELGAIVSREVSKALKEYKENAEKEKSEAEKLESMTDEQKKDHVQKKKDDELEALKKKVARIDLSKAASKLLRDAEVDPTEEVLDFVVGEDAETTSKNIEKFVAIKNAIVLASDKARNTGKTPKVITGGDGTKKLTKDDLIKMPYKEVLAYKTKYPEDYKKIMED